MLTPEDVEEIALLARLELTAEQTEELRGELSAILEHMDALAAVDTDGVEPMTHAVPMPLRLRADDVAPSLPPEVALGQSATTEDDCFVVPHIIKSGS